MIQPPAAPSSRGGCLKAFLITLLVLLLLAGAATYYVVTNLSSIVQNVSSHMVTLTAQAVIAEMGLLPAEKAEVTAVIDAFSARIKAGEISAEQGVAILTQLSQGPLGTLIIGRGFENKYLEQSTIPEEEKASAQQIIRRYVNAAASGAISSDEASQLLESVMKPSSEASKETELDFPEKLADSEIREVVSKMEQSLSEHNLVGREFPIKIADEIQKAIDRGITAAKSKGEGSNTN